MNRIFLLFLVSCALALPGCSSKKAGTGEGDGALSEADLASRDARFGEGNIPTAETGGPFRTVHFGYDSSSIDDVARQDIEFNAQVLQNNPSVRVTLEGHCDERGTAQYNLALGDRRSQSVADILLSYGIPRNRLNTISYGAEVPVDPGHSEEAWAKNRRVYFGIEGNTLAPRG